MTVARRYLCYLGSLEFRGERSEGEKTGWSFGRSVAAAFMSSLSACSCLWLAGPSESADYVSNDAEEEDGEGERDF